MATTVTKVIDTRNHIRQEYVVDKVFLNFPNQQKLKTFVNGTASARTIVAGTLVGITTADQSIVKTLQSDATDGSQIPYGFLLYDITIDAGASEELDELIGFGDDQSSIYEDKITLEKVGDTLDTVITELGISIKNAIAAYTHLKLEPAALDISAPKDTQV